MDPARAGCGGGVVDRDAAAAEERPGSRGSRRAHRPLLRRAGPARAAFRDARPHRDLRQASPRAGDREQAAAERRAQPRRHHRDVAPPRRPHARAAHGSHAAGARGAPRVLEESAGVERPFTQACRRGSGRSPDRARAGRRRLHRAARGRISHIRRRSRAPRGRGTVRCRARKTRAHRPGPGQPGGAMSALPIVLMTEEEVAALGRDSDAGFGALRSERGLLPLAAMDVDARVAGVVASIDVAQTFVNTTGQAIEATYIFPLPDRAAVHRFRMEVAGRVIEGVVDERGAARERYDEAIAKGHRAAITEEERAGVFTLRVGNLMPGEAATVRLSLVGPLPVDDGDVTLRFPLVVAPRYMPGTALQGDQAGLGAAADTDLVPDASRISPPVLLPGCPNTVRLGLRVALDDSVVSDVASSLHAVTSKNRDARIIEVQPGEKLDRDFILRWRVGGRGKGGKRVCRAGAGGAGGPDQSNRD